ncbi:MAG: hypothetical protein OXE44_12140 [Nitrospinae bacterium]|nr:hypothetical protein [Nitrospinota bacterium]
MSTFPFFFTFVDKVEGNGFVADIRMMGTLLGMKEDDSTWMYGVQPGGIAATGQNEDEAFSIFRRTYTSVLFDMAEDADDFTTFKQRVEVFFNEICEETKQEWDEAVEAVRRGDIGAEGLEKKNADDHQPYVQVRSVKKPKAGRNMLDEPRAIAA